jgi:hypothetical protein
MARIGADHEHLALPLDHFAVFTDAFNAGPNFHRPPASNLYTTSLEETNFLAVGMITSKGKRRHGV